MIEEQYVSFDTARMLKEAGFDAPCYKQYSDTGIQWESMSPSNFNADDWGYSCPTQAFAARWLREVYHYAVCVWFSKDHEKCFMLMAIWITLCLTQIIAYLNTYMIATKKPLKPG